jgi:hypothetical protein
MIVHPVTSISDAGVQPGQFPKIGKLISYLTRELAAVRISPDAITLFDPF